VERTRTQTGELGGEQGSVGISESHGLKGAANAKADGYLLNRLGCENHYSHCPSRDLEVSMTCNGTRSLPALDGEACLQTMLNFMGSLPGVAAKHTVCESDCANANAQDEAASFGQCASAQLVEVLKEWLSRRLDEIMEWRRKAQAFLSGLLDRIRPAFEPLARFVLAVSDLSCPAEVEEYFLKFSDNDRYLARLKVLCCRHLAPALLEERKNGRALGSAIRALAHVERSTPLVISRRAREVADVLARPTVQSKLHDGLRSIGLDEWAFKEVLSRAVGPDETACREVIQVGRRLRPFLPDPRGRPLSPASAFHELLIGFGTGTYTRRPDDRGDPTLRYPDLATRATRAEFSLKSFCPERAARRGKAWRSTFTGR
jgi:hypothetical protein